MKTEWVTRLLSNDIKNSTESVLIWSHSIYIRTTTTTTTVLRPFVWDYPGEPIPEETLTHPPSWSSSNLYQLLPSTTIHSILLVQITCLAIFLHNLFPCPLLVYLLVWSPPPHIPFISSPNQCLLFTAHAHTIATCFAVSILYHLFLVFLSTSYLELCLYLNIAHLCSLKFHLIFFPDRPTYVHTQQIHMHVSSKCACG